MDRVISQPHTARSLRERVESRRVRKQRFSAVVSTVEDIVHFTTGLFQGPGKGPISKSETLLNSSPLFGKGKLLRNGSWISNDPLLRSDPLMRNGGPRTERARRSFSKENISKQKALPNTYMPLASQGGWNPGQWAGDSSISGAGLGLKKYVIEFIVAVMLVSFLGFGGLSLSRNAHRTRAESPKPTAEAVAVVPTVKPEDEKLQILLLGSDKRESDNSFRTDVVILLTIDTVNGQASMLSFPRDLVGKIPGYGDGRINIAMQQGGFSLLQETLKDSFGANPKNYFLINFSGFVGVINSIGGIEVEAAEPLTDSCDLYWSTAGMCTIEPGRHTMDGDTALWYVRSRHTSSDFDRLRRAQEVMTAVYARFMQMNAAFRLPELYMQYNQDVETNMGLGQIASLLPTAIQIASDPERIHRYTIPTEITADWIMADGARVLLPNYDAVKEIVREATFGE